MKVTALLSYLYLVLMVFSANLISNAQSCVPATALAGHLDSCFGTGGKLSTQIGGVNNVARAVVTQPDEKIIVAGSTDASGTMDFALVRYNADGSLDNSFGTGGKVTTDFDGQDNYALSMKLQTDGKIVVSGSSKTFFAVARYNPDGSLDTSFDGDGKVTTDIGMPGLSIFNSLTIQTNGKIVVSGSVNFISPGGYTTVVRYNADGSLDTSFDGDGKTVIDQFYLGSGIAVQQDGKLFISGRFGDNLAVARLNADGSLDTTFGTNGIASFVGEMPYGDAFTLALEANGKIIAVGALRDLPMSRGCGLLVRFSTTGAVESSAVNCNSGISGVYVQPDGKILTAGFDDRDVSNGFQVIRYNSDFSFDNTFNGNGMLRLGFISGITAGIASCYGITMTRDRKIVAVGLADEDNPDRSHFAVARIMSGLAAQFDFDGDARADISVFRPSTGVWYGLQSSNAQVFIQNFGLADDRLVPADYDGDGQTDLAVFRPSSGDWWFVSSGSGAFNTVHWGTTGDVPRPSDFDGDGRADFVVYRPSNGVWYRLGSAGATSIVAFGTAEDKPLIGDFDGDGKTDLAVFRPSTGDWWRQSSVDNSAHVTHWGISTDAPVPADYDDDGKTDLAVYRDGTWYVLNSGNGQAMVVNFGLNDDKPVAADYDGDGRADIAVFRPSNGTWYLLQSTAGFGAVQFGVSNDTAIPNALVN